MTGQSSKLGALMRSAPVIPVLVIEQLEHALPLARALVAGGLPNLEITLRSDAALAAIEAIAAALPDAQVGVGTALTPGDVRRAADAGATFAVSPGLPSALREADLPIDLLPGAATPTEMMTAYQAGFSALKLFPATVVGGEGMLKAVSGPLPQLTFCPTGGVTETTLPRFLALPNVACVGGSWLAPKDAVARGDWDLIETLAARAVAIAAGEVAQAKRGTSGATPPQAGEEDPGSALETSASPKAGTSGNPGP